MTPYQLRLNPYIRRMAEDMKLRNLSPRTIDSYTYHVDKFCHHFGKPAEQLGPEEIRQYQLYLVNEKKASWSSFNQAVCGSRGNSMSGCSRSPRRIGMSSSRDRPTAGVPRLRC